jgi:glycosyltransferase involved in cell wall biosynthesis
LHVSVVVCTFEGEDFVAEQLNSILTQTRPPDEIVIRDDGSTDETLAEVEEAVANCQRDIGVDIRENPETLGYVKNFTEAIRDTTGDVIFLSDQDDIWAPTKIETCLDAFQPGRHPLVIYHDALVLHQDGRSRDRTLFDRTSGLPFASNITAAEYMDERNHVKGCTMAIRSEMKEHLPVPNGWGHDQWLTLMATVAGSIHGLGTEQMNYRRHGDNFGDDTTFSLLPSWALALRRPSDGLAGLARRWERAADRIERHQWPGNVQTRAELFAAACRNRAETLSRRAEVREEQFPRRLLSSTRLLADGAYHGHGNGLRSFVRDLIG